MANPARLPSARQLASIRPSFIIGDELRIRDQRGYTRGRPQESASWLTIVDSGTASLSLPWRWVEMITKNPAFCSKIPSPLRQIVLPLPMNDTL